MQNAGHGSHCQDFSRKGSPKNTKFKGRLKVIDEYAYTISTKQVRVPNSGIIDLGNGKYRYLTERECLRLMGFDDEDFDRLRSIYPQRKRTTSSILYKQAGNSIVVNVLERIVNRIFMEYKKRLKNGIIISIDLRDKLDFVKESKHMFLISLNYVKPISEVERLLPQHIVFLNKYYDNGNFIFSGRKNPRTGGVILAVSANLEMVNKIITEDPFYIQGIAEYSVTEFEPTKTAKDISKFFEI